jgi:hypothetical protein
LYYYLRRYSTVLTEYVEPGVLPDGLVGAVGSDLQKKIWYIAYRKKYVVFLGSVVDPH